MAENPKVVFDKLSGLPVDDARPVEDAARRASEAKRVMDEAVAALEKSRQNDIGAGRKKK